MKIEKISINGKIQKPGLARIAATDHGLMYGINAFESLRVHKNRSFLLNEHFDRLKKSLDVLGIKWADDRKKYCAWIAELCNDLPADKDAFIRFVVTAGGNTLWVSETSYDDPTVIIYRGNIPFYTPKNKQAIVLKDARRIKPEYFPRTGFRIKTMDYMSSRTAKLELKEAGEKLEGILLTEDGYIAEALTSNIFWTKKGQLYTPPLKTGILPGTMRAYLISNYKVDEVLAKPEEIETADEVILTSSGKTFLSPLSEINGIKKPGKTGPIFKKLYQRLIEDVKKDSISI